MNIDTDLVTAQEFDWVIKNEPTFTVNQNRFIGKVGRTPTGEDIRIRITLPQEFYPVVKPEVEVITPITHPNIEPDGTLSLQLLDEWDPEYRLKDIIFATRRLFLRSRKAIEIEKKDTDQVTESVELGRLRKKVSKLQEKMSQYSREITKIKEEKLDHKGVNSPGVKAVPISPKADLEASKYAISDLLSLLEIKFEDADIDEITYFRLYRRYSKEYYLVDKKLTLKGGNTNELHTQVEKRPIRN